MPDLKYSRYSSKIYKPIKKYFYHIYLDRKESPTGLIHKTMCRLFLTRLIKKLKIASLSPSCTPASFASERHPVKIFSYSSASNKFGTSPLFKILFTSSKKPSKTICVSVNKKTVFSFLTPVLSYNIFKSS